MNFDDRFAEIGKVLERELSREFPGWIITRQGSRQWSAVLPGHGSLTAQSAAELRDRLRDHTRK